MFAPNNSKLNLPRVLALLSLFVAQANSFAGFDPALIHQSIDGLTHAADALIHHHSHVVASAPAVTAAPAPLAFASHVLGAYKQSLASHPLQTKMMTGAVLASAGDAIAQSREPGDYDKRRACSFAAFDMAYRALQHASFPIITEYCKGQVLTGALASVGASQAVHMINPDYFAAVEQTLASQLGIVPFLYYPVFFAMTGAIQGLSVDGSVERAKEKFLPLMKRNLLFWLPVQFVQFGFIEENLQIPFLSVCGLAWTFILSIMAGNANAQATSNANATVDQEVAELNKLSEEASLLQEQLGDLATNVFAATNTASVNSEDLSLHEEITSYSSEEQESGLVYDKSY